VRRARFQCGARVKGDQEAQHLGLVPALRFQVKAQWAAGWAGKLLFGEQWVLGRLALKVSPLIGDVL